MWLKILYDKDDISEWWSNTPNKITVALDFSKTAPISDEFKSFRVSPIFSLAKESSVKSIINTKISFFNFQNAYRVLGRIVQLGTAKLNDVVFFSCGLSSILLITDDKDLISEFKEVSKYEVCASEQWQIEDSVIKDVKYEIFKENEEVTGKFELSDFSNLPLAERAMIDEFKITIHLLLLKLRMHMPSELQKINKLIEEINLLIIELVFLEDFKGEVPSTISEFSKADLQDKKTSNIIKHQNLDRIIQVNSALSYVSTQAFSGAIPILERRSLVRRNSLLGIGSAILALNNIARFIEDCFSKVPFEDVIIKGMAIAAPLKGLDELQNYDAKNWHEGSVSKFANFPKNDNNYFKLPFFNGRLGFRETEYSIAAAIQSISSGASLEWSLMTVTHEMLHGHVRNIMTFIFYGNDSLKDEDQRDRFYENFIRKVKGKNPQENLIDSLRAIVFTYCCYSLTHGSLTVKKERAPASYEIQLPDKNLIWNIFERENRNINEIFVHILDLHYFYASRISIYIPLIWCSWVAVPYVSGDIRQYILRSILTISSKIDGTFFERFNNSILRLKELLEKYQSTKLNHPVIKDVINILEDTTNLHDHYFPAFRTSIIIVDMIVKVFTSETIRASIFYDDLVTWEDDDKIEDSFEKVFKYNLANGFNDEIIKSPISYLLNKMISELNADSEIEDLEKETTLQFLALNSN